MKISLISGVSIFPTFLSDGDFVHLVSSARFVDQEIVENAVTELEHHGLRAILAKGLYATHHQFAGTDDNRASAVQEALDSPDSQAVLFMRGGYGTQRIIDRLDFRLFADTPKWLIGFSDVTALHSHINNVLNISSIHHAMASTYPATSKGALAAGFAMLKGRVGPVSFQSKADKVLGSARGTLLGGNLSVLHTLIGTSSAMRSEGAILFIEDLDEMLYHLDRILLHMRRANQFLGLKGAVIGGFSQMRDNTVEHGFRRDNPFGKDAEAIIWEHLGGLGIPVAFGFPAGHIEENMPLLLGAEVELIVEEAGSVLRYI